MAGQAHMRTPGRVRIFCFVVSLMVHNAWTIMRSDRRAADDDRRIPATPPGFLIVLEACEGPGIWPPRKPPP